ncbi:hypothetical protein HK097_002057 [Rhizophlyctis rosea]|uniref:Uncharacterized protein n=1 Tax=Rhizophlyctis rosea TaxID=64517 RepID=A0AAD5SGL8_9FUNG|nr:hypothetical protein HK097_002057 [Rhizophlyctis rosea]
MAGNQNATAEDGVSSPIYQFGFGILVLLCAAASYYFREGNSVSSKDALNMESASDLLDKDSDDDKRDEDASRANSGSNGNNGSFKAFQRNYLLGEKKILRSVLRDLRRIMPDKAFPFAFNPHVWKIVGRYRNFPFVLRVRGLDG